jgi:hypothetical protein
VVKQNADGFGGAVGFHYSQHARLRVDFSERAEDMFGGIRLPVHYDVAVVREEPPVVADGVLTTYRESGRGGPGVLGGLLQHVDQFGQQSPDISRFGRIQVARCRRPGVRVCGSYDQVLDRYARG